MSLTTSAHWAYNPGGGFYDYEIDNSFRLDWNSNHNLARTPASAGDRQKWTLSFWWKRGRIATNQPLFGWGNTSQTTIFAIAGYAGESTWDIYDYNNGTDRMAVSWSNKVRDPSAWYHIVLRIDTTQATASNRVRLYINGEAADSSGGRSSYPSQNLSLFANNNTPAYVGRDPYNTNGAGYYADVNFIDGQSLDPTSFAETKSGVWVPKEYAGSYGTNGYFLKFQNSSALGTDSSGNGNNFTVYNASAHDQMPDTPTNNFATFNSVGRQYGQNLFPSLSQGNLQSANSGNTTNTWGTFSINPGDTQGYYWEVICYSMDNARTYIGLIDPSGSAVSNPAASYGFYDKAILSRTGDYYGGQETDGSGATRYTSYTANDIISVAYKDGKIWFAKNGTWMNSGDPAAGTGYLTSPTASSVDTTKTWTPFTGYNSSFRINFGQDSSFAGTITAGGNSDENGYGDFKYSVPSGFLAMCTANLPAPAIDPAQDDVATDYFNTLLFTGDGTSSHAVTGVGFSPDLVWLKNRVSSESHSFYDTARTATRRLISNTNAAETSQTNGLLSFDSNGFTLGNHTGVNRNGDAIVSWNWKAGGTGVTNTNGSITSTVSANTDAGFSIVKYVGNATAGATVGHGLLSAPEMIILKNRDRASDYQVYHKDVTPDAPPTHVVWLNLSSGRTDQSRFNDTTPTSSVFYIGPNSAENHSGEDLLAYCFHSVDGFSKVGSYIGNGSADGTFIYTGFRPAWIMIKRSDSSGDWHIIDDKRIGYNDSNRVLIPNSSAAEQTNYSVQERDILSNGFKMRDSNTGTNASGGRYIYLAFAQNPFKYANAR